MSKVYDSIACHFIVDSSLNHACKLKDFVMASSQGATAVGRKPRKVDTTTYRGRFAANLRKLRNVRPIGAWVETGAGVSEEAEILLVTIQSLRYPVELSVTIEIEKIGEHIATAGKTADRPVLLRIPG